MRSCANRSLMLDPTLIQGHQALAGLGMLTADWALAEQHSGIEDVCPMRCSFLGTVGQLDLALVHSEITLTNNPGCSENMITSAVIAWLAGRYDLARDRATRAVSMGYARDLMPVVLLEAEAALAEGDPLTAASELSKAFAPLGCQAEMEPDLRHIYSALADNGKSSEFGRAALRRLHDRFASQGVLTAPIYAGLLFMLSARLGELDRAYEVTDLLVSNWKKTGIVAQPSLMLFWAQEMQAFRADPRFVPLCAELGMVDYWRRFGLPRSLAHHPLAAEFAPKTAAMG